MKEVRSYVQRQRNKVTLGLSQYDILSFLTTTFRRLYVIQTNDRCEITDYSCDVGSGRLINVEVSYLLKGLP